MDPVGISSAYYAANSSKTTKHTTTKSEQHQFLSKFLLAKEVKPVFYLSTNILYSEKFKSTFTADLRVKFEDYVKYK